MKKYLFGLTTLVLVITLSFSGLLPILLVQAQNFDIVGGSGDDIAGGSSVFVFRKSRKAAHIKTAPRVTAGRTVKEKATARVAVAKKAEVIAKARPKPKPKKIDQTAFAKLIKPKSVATPTPVKGRPNPNPTPDVDVKETLEKSAVTVVQKEALADTLVASADVLSERGEKETAKQYYTDALKLDPNNEAAKIAVGAMLAKDADRFFDAGRYESAISLYEDSVKNDPENAGAYAGLGDAYEAIGDKVQAKRAYQNALKINPDLTELFYPLGVLGYETGDVETAQTYLNKVAAIESKNAQLHNYLGLTFAKQNNQKEAVAEFNKALQIDENFADAYHNLGDMYDKLDRDKDATASFQKAIAIYETQTPKPARLAEAYYDLGVSLYNREKYGESSAAYEKARKVNPLYYEALVNLADSYRQEKRFNDALGVYAIAVEVGRNKPNEERSDIFGKYGYCAGKAKQWKLSIDVLKKAIALKADALDYVNLGWALNNSAAVSTNPQPLYEEARVALEKAAQMDTGFAPAKQNLGDTYNLSGEFKLAVEILKPAVEIYKQQKQTELQALSMIGLGFAYRGLSQKEKEAGNENASKDTLKKSVETFREATKLNNKLSSGYFFLGVVESESGNVKDAQKALERLRELNSALALPLENILKRRAIEELKKKGYQEVKPGKEKEKKKKNYFSS